MRKSIFALLTGCILAVTTLPSVAQEAQLKLVRFASEDTPLTQAIARLVQRINTDGKGIVQISSVVGPEAVPVNQMGTALKNGIVDAIIVPPSYVSNLQPGIQGLSAMQTSPQQQRANGTYDLVNSTISKTLNAVLIGQLGWGTDFNLFMREPMTSIDQFKGMRIRTSNTYRKFIEALGAQPFQASRSEIYTAMERGVIQGYVNQKMEVLSAGWGKVTGYMVKPSFYHGMSIMLVNLNTWNRLNATQRDFLARMGKVLEQEITLPLAETNRSAEAKLIKAGMKVIEFPAEQSKKFSQMAYDSTWDGIEKVAPDFGAKLRKIGLTEK